MRKHSKAYWDQIEADRSALVEMLFATGSPETVWPIIRSLLRESDGMRETALIYEMHHRTFLPILQLELVSRFVERFRFSGVAALCSSLDDEDPAVVAYSLFTLSQIGLNELREGGERIADRQERIHAQMGSFAWEGTLAEYGSRLIADKEEEKES